MTGVDDDRLNVPRWVWAIAGLVIVVGAAVVIFRPRPAPALPQPATRLTYTLPADQNFSDTSRHKVAISPDGSRFAYLANRRIFLRSRDQTDARLVAGAHDDAEDLLFSPDGRWIAYFLANGEGAALYKIPIAGGTPVALATFPHRSTGASWQGDVIAVGQGTAGVATVPENGGVPATIASVDETKHESASSPQLLNGGRAVLFTLRRGDVPWNEAQLVVYAVRAQARRLLVDGGSDGRVLPSGFLVYAKDAALYAAPFDLARSVLNAEPVAVVVGVEQSSNPVAAGHGQFSVADNGQLAYVPSGGALAPSLRTLAWVDREGREDAIQVEPHAYWCARLSPDGSKVGLDVREAELNTWIWDISSGALTRLPAATKDNRFSEWMPDGQSFIYSGDKVLYRRPLAGGGPIPLIQGPDPGEPQPMAVSPDGRYLIYRSGPGTNYDLLVLTIAGDHRQQRLVATSSNEVNPTISPDGRWMAYQSDESGRFEIYVRPFPDVASGRWQISSGGGKFPRWSKSASEVYYVSSGDRMISVPVTLPSFKAAKPVPLFETTPYFQGVTSTFDVAADGRFLMIKKEARTPAQLPMRTILIVDHWVEELRARFVK